GCCGRQGGGPASRAERSGVRMGDCGCPPLGEFPM
ncbi:MAG: hypothetical protein AVDCRST_MAG87-569, partial [uncultured Thermomicrobiales bacterium]